MNLSYELSFKILHFKIWKSESTNIALSGLKWFVENCNARHSSVIVTEIDVKLKYLELSKKFSEDSLKQNKDTYRSKFIACLENSE